ncbi:MAG: nickel-dependent lactate racemase, partial [Gemmataceae bacterium]|nr:nickel-dependent lactate racemase [Gemmataceae bacterium]
AARGRRAPISAPTRTPAELMRAALETPYQFEPLRRALTPDDRVAVVFDPRLPHAGEMLAELLRHLGGAGVTPATVTVVSPAGSAQGWIDALPDEFDELTAELHDPADARKLMYVATTKAGRRVYLNRAVGEADFVVVLAGRRYDPHAGYAGAEAALFPALSDEETQKELAGAFSSAAPDGNRDTEAAEVAWLLGSPFFVQVIEGSGNTVQDVVAGLFESGTEGLRRQDARWRATLDAEVDTVIASIGGESEAVTFLDLAQAAATAARAVKKGGRIALLTAAAPAMGPGAELLGRLDGPAGAKKLLDQEKPPDWAAARLWVFAARSASLFLASGYPDEVTEGLFGTPIRTPSEVQRLIDTGSGSVLLIPDAHKAMVTVG